MNDPIGMVIDIVYDDPQGSKIIAVVDFPELILNYSLIPGSLPTHILIPITDPGKTWERVVVWLTTRKQRGTPCAELVGFSRATDSEMMTIGNTLHELDRMRRLKTGQGKTVDIRREFKKK